MLSKAILALSILWSVWQVIWLRNQVIKGRPVVPPLVAGSLIFSICVVGVILLGASPLHLIWLLVVSYVLGIVLMFFTWFQKIVMTFVVLLAMTGRQGVDDRIQARTTHKRNSDNRDASSTGRRGSRQ